LVKNAQGVIILYFLVHAKIASKSAVKSDFVFLKAILSVEMFYNILSCDVKG
jgi:hypothetical protein